MADSKRFLFLIFLIAFLPACVSIPKPGPQIHEEIWQDRRISLSAIRDWRLQARIGIVSKQESGSGNLYWEQSGETFLLRVSGPFGRGLTSIEGNEHGTTLRDNTGEVLMAESPEILLWQQTGWRIPVKGLRYWILGLPSGLYKDEIYDLDALGQITGLQAGDWRIEFQQYGRYGSFELPVKINMQNEQIKIKLVILDWKILNH